MKHCCGNEHEALSAVTNVKHCGDELKHCGDEHEALW